MGNLLVLLSCNKRATGDKMETENGNDVEREEFVTFGEIKRSSYASPNNHVYYELTEQTGDRKKTVRQGYGFEELRSYRRDNPHPQTINAYLVGEVRRNVGVIGESYFLVDKEIRFGFSEEEIKDYLFRKVHDERVDDMRKMLDDKVFVRDLENRAGGGE